MKLRFLKELRARAILKSKKNISFGKHVTFGRGTVFNAPHHMDIGNDVYIGKYCSLEADINIGSHVLIANNVGMVGRYDHDYTCIEQPITKAPWIGNANYSFKGKNLKIVVEADVWIGFGTLILTGVTIGRGSIIGGGHSYYQRYSTLFNCRRKSCKGDWKTFLGFGNQRTREGFVI